MKTTQEKSIEVLDFPKVKQELSQHTQSDLGKKMALALKPSTSIEEIKMLLNQTGDGVSLLRMKGGIPVTPFESILPQLKRLSIGGGLNGGEIASIMKIIKNAREIKNFFREAQEDDIVLENLYAVSDMLNPLSDLSKTIQAVVDEDGRVVDSASPKLIGIRTGIKQVEQSIRQKLENITRGSKSRYLTDAIITIRNDRYVVPVKADSKNVFGGIVHDQSATGQTLFVEPQSVLNQNNKLREYTSQEKAEVDRLLADLSQKITPYSKDLEQDLQVLTLLDFIAAKAKYSRQLSASQPIVDDNREIALYGARHPLIDPEQVVENDITLGLDYKAIVVTGPNTGGKTVVLKTIGLLQIMGQSGLHLPVKENSRIGVFEKCYADIGDEQSIEQSLSTFSSHMTNIVSILSDIDEATLIVLDELGAGTDPQEGAALAIAILDYISARGSTVVITSHYPELKAYAYNRPETINASMAFDVNSLKPTYKLLLGIPGRSNAFEVAQRLGLNNEIIAASKQLMSGESQSVNQMIEDLEAKRQAYHKRNQSLQKELYDASKLHNDLKNFYEAYQERSQELEDKAKDKANRIVEKAQEQADQIIDDLRQKQLNQPSEDNIKEHEFIDAKSRLSNMKYEQKHLKQNKVLQKEKEKKALAVGDQVHVDSFDQEGTLVDQTGDSKWVVQMGMLKMKIDEEDLTLLEKGKSKQATKQANSLRANVGSVKTEIDLRGERVDQAVHRLDQYIDQALLANYGTVTVIHGMGTGAVRKAVKDYLSKHKRVQSYNDAPANQGGNGATIVKFKQ